MDELEKDVRDKEETNKEGKARDIKWGKLQEKIKA